MKLTIKIYLYNLIIRLLKNQPLQVGETAGVEAEKRKQAEAMTTNDMVLMSKLKMNESALRKAWEGTLVTKAILCLKRGMPTMHACSVALVHQGGLAGLDEPILGGAARAVPLARSSFLRFHGAGASSLNES